MIELKAFHLTEAEFREIDNNEVHWEDGNRYKITDYHCNKFGYTVFAYYCPYENWELRDLSQ